MVARAAVKEMPTVMIDVRLMLVEMVVADNGKSKRGDSCGKGGDCG
jgi:hypothetical protein